MALEYRIDHALRLVMARCSGTLTERDFFDYQQTVWSQAEVAGYDELVDMSNVEHMDTPSANQIRQLADLSAAMDASATSSKFAIIAPGDLCFGLGRMYQAYRGLNERSAKEVGVFRTLAEAWEWLGHQEQGPLPAENPIGEPD